MKKTFSCLAILTILLLGAALAEESAENEGKKESKSTDKGRIKELYDKLRDMRIKYLDTKAETNFKEYPGKIGEYRNAAQEYILLRRKSCESEFTSFVLGADKLSKKERKKLNKNERNMCYYKLKKFQLIIIDRLFLWQKSYLGYIHKNDLRELEEIRQQSIGRLETGFKKIR